MKRSTRLNVAAALIESGRKGAEKDTHKATDTYTRQLGVIEDEKAEAKRLHGEVKSAQAEQEKFEALKAVLEAD